MIGARLDDGGTDAATSKPADDPVRTRKRGPESDAAAGELTPAKEASVQCCTVRYRARAVHGPPAHVVQWGVEPTFGRDGHDAVDGQEQSFSRRAKVSTRWAPACPPRVGRVHGEQCERGPARSCLTGAIDDRQVRSRKREVESQLTVRSDYDGNPSDGQLPLACEGLVSYEPDAFLSVNEPSPARRGSICVPHERRPRVPIVQLFRAGAGKWSLP
jgi:hypothetical protein